MSEEFIIECENVKFSYPESPTFAVNNVSFAVKKGEFLSIIGHNGSGKSTLSRLFNGLLEPDDGKIAGNGFGGRQKRAGSAQARRHRFPKSRQSNGCVYRRGRRGVRS